MDENKKFFVPRILLIVIILAIVLIASIGILFSITGKKSKEQEKENQIIQNQIESSKEEKKVDYTYLDEGIAKQELPKVEIGEIAETNSTIDGRIPCFYNPVIPKGFKAVGIEQDDTIDEKAKWGEQNSYLNGLVIEDEHENQFVWVPVENMDLFKTTDWQKNTPKGSLNDNYIEPLKDEEEEYQKMYYKVKKYGGFYIGRFETGDLTANRERTSAINSDSIGIKKYLNAYNYVPYKLSTVDQRQITGAQELAINFGKRNNYNTIVTSVVYGVQWDMMLRFIASDVNNVNNSLRWGNYSTSELTYTDINKNSYTKTNEEVRLLKTGSSEDTKAKNIYDVAGNLFEWTKETNGADTRVVRGGCYVANAMQLAASRYTYTEETSNNAIGFRISFYIK